MYRALNIRHPSIPSLPPSLPPSYPPSPYNTPTLAILLPLPKSPLAPPFPPKKTPRQLPQPVSRLYYISLSPTSSNPGIPTVPRSLVLTIADMNGWMHDGLEAITSKLILIIFLGILAYRGLLEPVRDVMYCNLGAG